MSLALPDREELADLRKVARDFERASAAFSRELLGAFVELSKRVGLPEPEPSHLVDPVVLGALDVARAQHALQRAKGKPRAERDELALAVVHASKVLTARLADRFPNEPMFSAPAHDPIAPGVPLTAPAPRSNHCPAGTPGCTSDGTVDLRHPDHCLFCGMDAPARPEVRDEDQQYSRAWFLARTLQVVHRVYQYGPDVVLDEAVRLGEKFEDVLRGLRESDVDHDIAASDLAREGMPTEAAHVTAGMLADIMRGRWIPF